MQSHTHAITYKTIFLFASLYLFSSRFIVLSLLIFHRIYFRYDFSIKVSLAKIEREWIKKKNRRKCSRQQKARRWWRKRFGLPLPSFPSASAAAATASSQCSLPAHILWQTVSIQLFIRVFGFQTFYTIFFLIVTFLDRLSTSINVYAKLRRCSEYAMANQSI